jgi:anti-anti-sigma regulatory factor
MQRHQVSAAARPADTEEDDEHVLNLGGDFDTTAFDQIRDFVLGAASPPRVIIDFHGVHFCHPLALSKLVGLLHDSEGAVRARGLCQQHLVLLRYFGFAG